jgi:hypothetical protein
VECSNESITCDIMGNWNYLTIIQKIAEQHNWKARHRLTRKHFFSGHCAYTSEYTNKNVQDICRGK